MQYLRTVLCFLGLIGLWQFVSADDHGSQMAAPIPVEFWICEYNEGKSASDLEPVIKEWKKTMGKGREYESWMLTPAYSSQNLNNGVVFTGWWPDFASMGSEVEYAMEKVNPKMDPKWLEVITCNTHAEGTAIQMRDGMDTNLESGMMTYQNCSLREGKTVTELMQANMQMNEFMDKAGVDSISAAIIFPGVGAPNGFDYTMTFWSPGMKKLGETFSKASKAGFAQVNQKLFGDLHDCDNGVRFAGEKIY